MESQHPMIEVKGLSKHYADVRAVDDISFEIRPGEVVGFLGPNGAGKTTTMKILTAFIGATYGEAYIDGLDVSSRSLEVRRKVGYLPENAPLYADMMVADYLRFVAEMRAIEPHRREAVVKDVAEWCAIGDVLGKDIGELSKGYRRREGLAQAMLHEPECLILDEPTEGLDPNQIVEIRELIKDIGREKTILLSSHILPEVQATCGRVIIIHKGRIIADGSTEDLQSELGQTHTHVKVDCRHDGGLLDQNQIRARLAELPFVSMVDVGEGEGEAVAGFEVRGEKGHDLRGDIFKLAVAQGWTLLEIRRDLVSLEDVFRRLTTS